jgi:hypothetical protein
MRWGILLLALLITRSAHASFGGDSLWIVSGGTSAGVRLQSGTPQTTTFDIGVGVGHTLGADFELMLLASYVSIKNSSSTTSSHEVGLQLNWVTSGGHSDAFYLGPRVGRRASKFPTLEYSAMVFGGALGKRFALGGPISYEPNVAVTVEKPSDSSITAPAYIFYPLQFTLFF